MNAATPAFDAIVAGLGAMGSAAASHLAARGQRVLGLEQYQPAHDRGSSHGHSRVIRLAYFEHPAYVPLLRRAYALWAELERWAGEPLLTVTGGLMVGHPESEVVRGALESARVHDLPHEVLDAAAIRRRFPPLTPASPVAGVFEPQAGVLRPEACVRAQLAQATGHGADLRFGECVTGWTAAADGGRVDVHTDRGTYAAGRLVLAPGAWAPDLFACPDLPIEIERQVLYWFEPVGGAAPFASDRFPVYVWDRGAGVQVYGFPAQDGPPGGVKVAFFRTGRGTRCTPRTIDRDVAPGEVTTMREAIAEAIPSLAGGRLRATATCMYTLTPDHHFVVGLHPKHPQVVIASPCSGHGFKFASVIGEILADLAIDGATGHRIDLFDPSRFAGSTGA